MITKIILLTINTIAYSSSCTNYKYTKEDIDNFFASDNGQQEEHSLEESICRAFNRNTNLQAVLLLL